MLKFFFKDALENNKRIYEEAIVSAEESHKRVEETSKAIDQSLKKEKISSLNQSSETLKEEQPPSRKML